ncbi:hypothetical protein MT390_15700 [Vibrio sp. 2-Bac 85]|uniref:replication initiation regulator SeqA n=1 Tax=Psychromonas sp. SA13A TaxID=2686346 RepID=UPI00140E1EF3|nr:replication initiation regulator SeqA [Psychromonas sp. SA13A]
MKTIEIEDDLYKYILNNIEAFGETPSQILRRLLALSEDNTVEKTTPEKKVSVENKSSTRTHSTQQLAQPNKNRTESNVTDHNLSENSVTEKNEHFHQGVKQLFTDPAFTSESVITNKFMMMLTTMYFEKKDAFIEAAETTKGRTRAYLGTDLQDLLNSDNEEELAQFKASKPRMIPQTPYWVITNANTGRKRIILTQMMASMGYPHHLIERIKEEI